MSIQSRMHDDGLSLRPVVARWVILADLRLETATLLGGEGTGITDMMILRDAFSECPLLPGSSLAGALRNHLCDVLGGYGSSEDGRVRAVFGESRAQDDRNGSDAVGQSPTLFFDSIGLLPESCQVEIRDGVAIEPSTGTADDHTKYDLEVLPSGTVFPIRIELVVSNGETEGYILALLIAALEGLSTSEIRIGVRKSRGLGEISTERWRAGRFDLSNKSGWLAWIRSAHSTPIKSNTQAYASPREACLAAVGSRSAAFLPEIDVKRNDKAIFSVLLNCDSSLLVRSPGLHGDEPDVTHLRSGGRSVLPGTSVAGVLRSRCVRIAQHVWRDRASSEIDSQKFVGEIFGPRDSGSRDKLCASRLRVSESYIDEAPGKAARIRSSRIRIDRLTQGVMSGALFDEEPMCGGTSALLLELKCPKPAEVGLVLLALKDLVSGDVPLGGSASVGRGVFSGEIRVTGSDGKARRLWESSTKDEIQWADEQIRALRMVHPGPAVGGSQ